MAGIKAKISNLLHKDKDTTTDTKGTHHDTTGHTTGGGLKGATAGYDATTGHDSTTGTGLGGAGGEREARTGMSDLDINKNSSGTGLREKSDTGEYGRTSNTGIGSTGYDNTSTTGTAGYGTTGGISDTTRTSGTGYGSTSNTGGVSQGVTRSYDNQTSEIIDQERFTKTEDHEIVIEKKAYELEHRPVEKKYVVETKYMGERSVPGRATELLGTEAREVEERVVEMPRGDRTIIVENVDVPVGLESAGQAINAHSTAGYGTTGLGQSSTSTTGYSDRDNLGGTGTTGSGYGNTGTGTTGSGYDNTGTGTGSGYGNTGTGTTGSGYGNTGTGTTGSGYGNTGTGTGSGYGNTGTGTTGSGYGNTGTGYGNTSTNQTGVNDNRTL